jgi:hypothetical protein
LWRFYEIQIDAEEIGFKETVMVHVAEIGVQLRDL